MSRASSPDPLAIVPGPRKRTESSSSSSSAPPVPQNRGRPRAQAPSPSSPATAPAETTAAIKRVRFDNGKSSSLNSNSAPTGHLAPPTTNGRALAASVGSGGKGTGRDSIRSSTKAVYKPMDGHVGRAKRARAEDEVELDELNLRPAKRRPSEQRPTSASAPPRPLPQTSATPDHERNVNCHVKEPTHLRPIRRTPSQDEGSFVSDSEAAGSDLEYTSDPHQRRNAGLIRRVIELEQIERSLTAQQTALVSDSNSLKQKLSGTERDLVALQESSTAEVKQARETQSTLEGKLRDALASVDVLTRQNAELTDASALLAREKARVEQAQEASEQQAQTWKDSSTQASQRNSALVYRVGQLGQKKSALERERDELVKKLAAAEQATAELRVSTGRDLGRAEEEKLALEARVDELNKQTTEQARVQTSLEEERIALVEKLTESEQARQELEVDSEQRIKEAQTAIEALTKDKADLQTANDRLAAERTAAEQAASLATESAAQWKESSSQLERKVASLVENVAELDVTAETLKQERDSLTRQKTGFNRQLAVSDRSRAEAEAKVADSASRILELKGDLARSMTDKREVAQTAEVAKAAELAVRQDMWRETKRREVLESFEEKREKEEREWEENMLGLFDEIDELDDEIFAAQPLSPSLTETDTPLRPIRTLHHQPAAPLLLTPETTPASLPLRPLPVLDWSPDTPSQPLREGVARPKISPLKRPSDVGDGRPLPSPPQARRFHPTTGGLDTLLSTSIEDVTIECVGSILEVEEMAPVISLYLVE